MTCHMSDMMNNTTYYHMLLQAVTLWLQYTSLLAGVNIPAPATLHWVFSAVNFAFSTVTSSSLSTDCLLSRPLNAALQRILIHLSVPVLVLAAMVLIQVVWYDSNCWDQCAGMSISVALLRVKTLLGNLFCLVFA